MTTIPIVVPMIQEMTDRWNKENQDNKDELAENAPDTNSDSDKGAEEEV